MSKVLTIDDARQSLTSHLVEKGAEVRQKYGPRIGWSELLALLEDRSCVRYPCEICFEAEPLLAGEFAHPIAKGATPNEGFTLCIHPFFDSRLESVPALVLYQLVIINYGEFASVDDAETFGAAALGISKEDYYQLVCSLADQIVPENPECVTGEPTHFCSHEQKLNR
jgi:hypothetical protein